MSSPPPKKSDCHSDSRAGASDHAYCPWRGAAPQLWCQPDPACPDNLQDLRETSQPQPTETRGVNPRQGRLPGPSEASGPGSSPQRPWGAGRRGYFSPTWCFMMCVGAALDTNHVPQHAPSVRVARPRKHVGFQILPPSSET